MRFFPKGSVSVTEATGFLLPPQGTMYRSPPHLADPNMQTCQEKRAHDHLRANHSWPGGPSSRMRTGLVVEVLRRNARHRSRACFTCKFLRMQLYGVTHSFWTDSCACGRWLSRYKHIMQGSCLYIWQISIMSWAHSVVYMASGISCAVSYIWGPCVRAAGVPFAFHEYHKHVYFPQPHV